MRIYDQNTDRWVNLIDLGRKAGQGDATSSTRTPDLNRLITVWGNNEELDNLFNQIVKGKAPPITAEEEGALRKYLADKVARERVARERGVPEERDRFSQPCGRAGWTGDKHDKQVVLNLLDQIATGGAPALTRKETATLRDYLAGKFKRLQGESIKREIAAATTDTAVLLVKRFKLEDGPTRSEDDIINEVRALMAGYSNTPVPKFETIKDGLHRDLHKWRKKRSENNKLK